MYVKFLKYLQALHSIIRIQQTVSDKRSFAIALIQKHNKTYILNAVQSTLFFIYMTCIYNSYGYINLALENIYKIFIMYDGKATCIKEVLLLSALSFQATFINKMDYIIWVQFLSLIFTSLGKCCVVNDNNLLPI
jgi:hypothetical protein